MLKRTIIIKISLQTCSNRGYRPVQIFEWYADELLLRYMIKPVSKGPILSLESVWIIINDLLICLIMIRCSCPCDVSKIWEWMLTAALPCVYRGHRPLFSLIFMWHNVKWHKVKVQETLPFLDLFNIAGITWLIWTIGFLLHFGDIFESGICRLQHSSGHLYLPCNSLWVSRFSILVQVTCHGQEVTR